MPLSGIIMLIFGCIVLYGGLIYFLYRAYQSKRKY
ncbi:MAG: MetS family NSS transporter small subunit [Candidatus Thermoplasmatota archaeon]|nr:MetS family NSS transporter small subunit [Candidatus Thermoplasmatota archaeon]